MYLRICRDRCFFAKQKQIVETQTHCEAAAHVPILGSNVGGKYTWAILVSPLLQIQTVQGIWKLKTKNLKHYANLEEAAVYCLAAAVTGGD